MRAASRDEHGWVRAMRSTAGAVMMVCVMLVGIGVNAAPIPSGPDVPTSQAFDERYDALLRDQIIGAYERVGSHNRRWDAAVNRLFEEMYRRWSDHPQARDYATLQTMAADVVNRLRCDDALAIYIMANVLDNQRRIDAAMPWLERAAAALGESGYSKKFEALAWRRIADNYRRMDRARDASNAYEKSRAAWIGYGLEAGVRDDPRIYWRIVYGDFMVGAPAEQSVLLHEEAVANGRLDAWVVKMMEMASHSRRAWEARGNGDARTVTDRGWILFERHQEIAAGLAVEAHEMRPDFPEAAAELIGIARAGYAPDGTDERYWFDRAVAAEFDNDTAYGSMLNSLMPRWEGSFEEMLAFGTECMETGRYDTDVPYVFFRALKSIVVDTDTFEPLIQIEAIDDGLVRMLMGYLDEGGHGSRYYDCLLAAVHYAAGRYFESQQVLFTVAYQELEPRAFSDLGLEMHTTLMLVAGLSEDNGETAQLLDDLMEDGFYERVIAICEELAEPHAFNPGLPLFKYYTHRAWVAEKMIELDEGRVADITPGPLLRGWLIRGGSWGVDEATSVLTGLSTGITNTPRGMMLACDIPIDDEYEISGRLEITSGMYREEFHAGVLVDIGLGHVAHGALVYPLDGVAQAYRADLGLSPQRSRYQPRQGGDELRVRVSGRKLTAWVNGEMVIKEEPLPNLPGEKSWFGLGGVIGSPNTYIRFREMRMKLVE